MADMAKNDKIESLVKTISELTSTNSSLTATIKKSPANWRGCRARAGGTNTAAPVAAAPVAREDSPVGATPTHTASPVATSYEETTTAPTATLEKETQITRRKPRGKKPWAAARRMQVLATLQMGNDMAHQRVII